MKCNNCGKVVDDDSNFCVYCGSEIKNIIEVKYLQDDVYVSSSQISIAEMQ
ncbi:MAG: zinc ribbon domain-containing protein, partial [Paludibacteraceae bacterium]|nr:zinc ribbon domain-containing protein [Paludibacteraceae bacterium]